MNRVTHRRTIILFLASFFFARFIILALLSRSLPEVTQIRSRIAGPPPPSPRHKVPSFCRENISKISSLVDSRRVVILLGDICSVAGTMITIFTAVLRSTYSEYLTLPLATMNEDSVPPKTERPVYHTACNGGCRPQFCRPHRQRTLE